MEDCTAREIGTFLTALRFSAQRHRDQRRKDAGKSPYINHPIDVVEMLWRVGGISDNRVLVAALLHDLIEDTKTEPEEIAELFGAEVLFFVLEVSDDKHLSKARRKQLQIEHAPSLSLGAKQIKLADKISNIYDITHSPPFNWPIERRLEYLDWARKVVAGLRGTNQALESLFDQRLAEGMRLLHHPEES